MDMVGHDHIVFHKYTSINQRNIQNKLLRNIAWLLQLNGGSLGFYVCWKNGGKNRTSVLGTNCDMVAATLPIVIIFESRMFSFRKCHFEPLPAEAAG